MEVCGQGISISPSKFSFFFPGRQVCVQVRCVSILLDACTREALSSFSVFLFFRQLSDGSDSFYIQNPLLDVCVPSPEALHCSKLAFYLERCIPLFPPTTVIFQRKTHFVCISFHLICIKDPLAGMKRDKGGYPFSLALPSPYFFFSPPRGGEAVPLRPPMNGEAFALSAFL